MMRVLFCNIAWMKEYRGNEDGKDTPLNGGSYVDETGDAHEKYNFTPVNMEGREGLYCCRSWGVSNTYKVRKLNELIRGWINYFKIGSMKYLCRETDKHIRYRIRMCIWKHWKTPQNRAENLIKLGVDKKYAWSTAYTGARIAFICQRGTVNRAITKERLTRFGLVSMLDYYTERCVTC